MLWTFYGAPAVAGLIFVVSINVAGLVLETIYVFIHFLFGNNISRVHFHILYRHLQSPLLFAIHPTGIGQSIVVIKFFENRAISALKMDI